MVVAPEIVWRKKYLRPKPEIRLEVAVDDISNTVRIVIDYDSLFSRSANNIRELRNGFIFAAAYRYNIEEAVKPFCTGAAWQRAKIGADL